MEPSKFSAENWRLKGSCFADSQKKQNNFLSKSLQIYTLGYKWL